MVELVLALLPLVAPSAEGREVIVLRGGARLEAPVIKETAEKVFVDLGSTVVEIPVRDIVSRESEDAAPEAAGAAPEREGVEYIVGAGGARRTVDELAGELGSSVVLVSCPSKTGSGFFVNRRGLVVTNFHVIEGERKISLTVFERRPGGGFNRRKVRDVSIVALNPYYDLAVLRVGKEELAGIDFTPAPLGDETELRAGEGVFAIGNPQGLERTVTEGIISTAARAFEGLLYLQTTAQINPGNSGGPLFNLKGEVIGVTNMKQGFLSEGLGFAIPGRRVKEVLDNLEAFAFDADNPNTGYHYLEPTRPGAPEK